MANQRCGEEITEDTTLDGDLRCASGPALIIAADNVTLDLGGHTVSGEPGRSGDTPGILMRRVNGSTVRNGTVQNFGAGVSILGGSRNVVQNVVTQDNVGSGPDLGDGIVVNGSRENRIVGNTARRNGPFSGISLLQDAQGNEVRDNAVSENNMLQVGDPSAGRQCMGIRVEGPAASNNTVVGNTVTGSGSSGITLHPTCADPTTDPPCVGAPLNQQNEIVGNTSSRNGTSGEGDGIRLFSTPNAVAAARNNITDNVANDNRTNGISIDARGVDGGTGNQVLRNRAARNGGFDGFDGNTRPACDANVWAQNQFGSVNQPCVRGTRELEAIARLPDRPAD
jgi:parallel beta-helix repeat protein